MLKFELLDYMILELDTRLSKIGFAGQRGRLKLPPG